MLRFLTAGVLVAGAAMAATTTSSSNVTFNNDGLPILQKNCQTCHRPREIGPMAFLNYEGTPPWAKSIKEAVLTKKMPPWFADPRCGHFANERKLSDADIQTVVAWVGAGAPQGNAKDMPAIAHSDNSANNPLNPDPTKTVRWGDQSWDEMLVPFVGVLVPPNADPATVTSHPRPGPVAAP